MAKRILIIDHDSSIRSMLSLALGDAGYTVREASSGADALDVVRSWQPDLIVVDLMMPTMTGWQFAEAYGGMPGPHAPIVVTSTTGPGTIRSTHSLGAISAVLAKPLDLDEFRDTVAFHLDGAER